MLFFPKSSEKRLDKQAQKFTPPPPPSVPPNDVKRILAVFLLCSTGFPYLVYPNSAFFSGGRSNGGGGGGGGADRTLGLFVKSFLAAFGEKTTQEHLYTSHRSACEVWVDSDILENFSRNGTNRIVARSHSIDKKYLTDHLVPDAIYPVCAHSNWPRNVA